LKSGEKESLRQAQEQGLARERDTNTRGSGEFATRAGGWREEFDTNCMSCCS